MGRADFLFLIFQQQSNIRKSILIYIRMNSFFFFEFKGEKCFSCFKESRVGRCLTFPHRLDDDVSCAQFFFIFPTESKIFIWFCWCS